MKTTQDPEAAEAAQTKGDQAVAQERLVRHCVDGTVVFKRSESDQCACCEGKHIYMRFLRLDDYGGWSNKEQERDADHFIREKVLFAENVENARVRITVEILPNVPALAASREENSNGGTNNRNGN